ncbi:MAG: B12-binding domain-containing radical SAM protein [Bacteroidales bacterium]|jgi:anaerobic magnesium-protoporphyrin IX monomethyl ester cyclase
MEKYDVIFIAPPFHNGKETLWKQFDYFFPPYGLAHIAAYIRLFGFNSKIIDCLVDCPDINNFENYFYEQIFVKNITCKFFGITAVTPNIDHAITISEIIKKFYPESVIILGGPHATHEYREIINIKSIDIIVLGEGEITLKEIIEGQNLAQIKGIVFKNKKNLEIIKTAKRERIKDLDILPIPAYDLLKVEKYKAPKYSNNNIPSMSIVTSRGCNGNCTFCSKIFKHPYLMSAERVLYEIEFLYFKYGIKQIIFYDDNFTIDKNRVKKICESLINKKIKIKWTCFARVDTVNKEILSLMKKAGCEHIMYGVENFNKKVIELINKNIKTEDIFNAVSMTKEVGIKCRVSLMIGNPGESKKTIWENIKMINKLNPDYLQILIFHPLPGAPIYNYYKKNHLITAKSWEEYNFTKPIFLHETLSQKQIKKYYILMYLFFYLHPKFLIKQIINLFKKQERNNIIWGLKAFISFILKNFILIIKNK